MQEWNQDWKLLESSDWVLVRTGLEILDLDFSSLLQGIWRPGKFFSVSQSFSFSESAEFYWCLPQQSLSLWNSRIRRNHYDTDKKKERKNQGTANQRIPSLILQGHSSSKKRRIQNLFPSNSRFRVSIWHQHLIGTEVLLLNSIITGTFLISLKNPFLPYYLDVRNWFLEIFGVWACFWWHGL